MTRRRTLLAALAVATVSTVSIIPFASAAAAKTAPSEKLTIQIDNPQGAVRGTVTTNFKNSKCVKTQCVLKVPKGRKVTLTETSQSASWSFGGWVSNGALLGSTAKLTIAMSKPKTVRATYFPTRTWNLAHDLVTNALSTSHANPFSDSYGDSGVWHMMGASGLTHDPSTYTDLPNTNFNSNTCNITGFDSWAGAGGFPLASVNTSATTYTSACDGHVTLPSQQAFLHPGQTNLGIYAWKSPVTGTVAITAGFSAQDCAAQSNGIKWSVDQAPTGATATQNHQLASGTYGNCGSGNTASGLTSVVHIGDYLYFTVDPNGNYNSDTTEVTATINRIR